MDHKVGDGKITYRLPNFIESQRLMVDLNILKIGTNLEDQLLFFANCLEKFEKFIEKVEVGKIDNFNELLNHPEFADDLREISAILLNRITAFTLEKKS